MSEVMGSIPDWLTLVGGVVTVLLGVREYRRGEDWKRSEFLAKEVDAFFASPKVATALLLIDYSEINLEPNGRRTTKKTESTLTLTDDIVTRGLAIHTDFADGIEQFHGPEMLVREAFDELLTGFERFGHHVKIGLVDADDVSTYLGYWIDKLTNESSGWKPAAFYAAFREFVDAYGYQGARFLFAEIRRQQVAAQSQGKP